MRYDTIISKTIQVKGASEELRSRLESSALRNFRSLNQEALARLEFSFDLEDALLHRTHQKWIDEALAGSLRPGSIQRLRRIAAQARNRR
jgi:hypothetical protein